MLQESEQSERLLAIVDSAGPEVILNRRLAGRIRDVTKTFHDQTAFRDLYYVPGARERVPAKTPQTLEDIEKWDNLLASLPPRLISQGMGERGALVYLLRTFAACEDVNTIGKLRELEIQLDKQRGIYSNERIKRILKSNRMSPYKLAFAKYIF